MLTIAICDDQSEYLAQLERLINSLVNDFTVEVKVMRFSSGEELIAFQQQHRYFFDALFLDIYMEGMTGMEVAKIIRQDDQSVPIVFLTSSSEYAVESYSVAAFDYILKPYAKQQIWQVLERILAHHRQLKQETICIKSHQNLYTLNLKRVVYFESTLRTITAYFNDGTSLKFYKKMTDLESEIASATFVRIHRSYLVNLLYMQNIVQNDVITTKQHVLPISKKYLNDVKGAFEAYLFQTMKGVDECMQR